MFSPFSAFLTYRSLLWQVTRRDIEGRYRGTSFGMIWAMLTPFLMLSVYTLAFGYVVGSRWPHTGDNKSGFAMILYVGLIVHGFFAECLTRAPSLVVGNPSYVKRVIFPLDVLPWALVIAALFHALVNIAVFALLYAFLVGAPPVTIIFFPVVMLPLVVLAAAVAWALASLGVYFRDIGQVTGVVSTALLFLSSAIVPLEAIPDRYRWLFTLNPLTFVIDQARDVALWGVFPDWYGLGLYLGASMIALYGCVAFFQRTRNGFADVV